MHYFPDRKLPDRISWFRNNVHPSPQSFSGSTSQVEQVEKLPDHQESALSCRSPAQRHSQTLQNLALPDDTW